jgi:hypothetical protein
MAPIRAADGALEPVARPIWENERWASRTGGLMDRGYAQHQHLDGRAAPARALHPLAPPHRPHRLWALWWAPPRPLRRLREPNGPLTVARSRTDDARLATC